MAKILIIDDHLTMVELIRGQLQAINSRLTSHDVFCFDYDEEGKLCLQAWPERYNTSLNRRVLFDNDSKSVFSAIYSFLEEHNDEPVLILIDLLLKSQNINAPSKETYQENHEFSCELYASLMKTKNGKASGYSVNCNNFFFLLYSRSDSSNSIVVTMLSQQYKEEEAMFFPCECYVSENISWCKNRCEVTDGCNSVVQDQDNADQPLALPDEYEGFIATLT